MKSRVPIEEALQESTTTPEQKQKLQLALKARKFAEQELGLTQTDNYTSFVQLTRPYVTYIVRVSEAYALKPHLWNYPMVGKLPYKGFFSIEEAKEEAKTFSEDKYDTYVRGATAYSTLGWFDDPILSSMLRYSDHDLVNLIIHETVHATLYIKGNADFNEQLATFLGDRGTEAFYRKMEGESSKTLERIRAENKDREIFSQYISKEIATLEDWYKLGIKQKQQKLEKLRSIGSKFTTEVAPKLKTDLYQGFAKRELNNAQLLSYKTYLNDLSDFERLFQNLGRDFHKMIKECKKLEKEDNPKKALKSWVSKKS